MASSSRWFDYPLDDAILAVVWAWNVFGLPALLLGVAVVSLTRGVGRGGRAETLRRVGWIHFGLAAWTAAWLTGEVRSYAEQGGLPANPWVTALPWTTLGGLADVAVGLGLRRGARIGWLGGVVLALWRTFLGGLFAYLGWRNGAVVDGTEWPRLAVSYALPAFLCILLLMPASVRAVRAGAVAVAVESPAPDRLFGLSARLWLVVVGSVALIDALDTAARFLGGP